MSSAAPAYLSHARYGKDKIRVFRVVREDKWHTIVEYNVTALLEGDIDTRRVLTPCYILFHRDAGLHLLGGYNLGLFLL